MGPNKLGRHSVIDDFQFVAETQPHRIALRLRNRSLTYKEVNESANALAHGLTRRGLAANQIVGVDASPAFDTIIAILAVMKAGAAFLPLSPRYPTERIAYMLETAEVRYVVSSRELSVNRSFVRIDPSSVDCDGGSTENIDHENHDSDLAYVIYTSGSTGRPKGVMIEHGSLYRTFVGLQEAVPFSSNRTILHLTDLSFDIGLVEILLPLCCGMSIIIADDAQRRSPRALHRLLTETRPDIIQMTPSRLRMLLQDRYEGICLAGVQDLLIGGEQLPEQLLNKVKGVSSARIYNLYGPTEATIWCSVKKFSKQLDEEVTVGFPIGDAGLMIVDGNLSPVSDGEQGELCIRGPGVARGYMNNPTLTDQRFVALREQGERIYLTGDIAQKLPNGEIKVLGRTDRMLKINGNRIYPEEIERCINAYEGIQQVAVVPYSNEAGFDSLRAFFVSAHLISSNEIYFYLKTRLPEYFLPTSYIQLDEMPLMPNEKVDLAALLSFGQVTGE